MFEKVNPSHPDKVADRIAGAIVDVAYSLQENPRIAVEVLIGHGTCTIIAETSVPIPRSTVNAIVERISQQPGLYIQYYEVQQDAHLAENQANGIRCGDNGIFKGHPITEEERKLTEIAHNIYEKYPSDGKYLLKNDGSLIICQSSADGNELRQSFPNAIINPLGSWSGGINCDSGATNRKIGSDMGLSATGGGLHGKDLSKADVSVNIYAHLLAQKTGQTVELSCAIGDDAINGKPYSEIVDIARDYISKVGGFEKFAEWGLI